MLEHNVSFTHIVLQHHVCLDLDGDALASSVSREKEKKTPSHAAETHTGGMDNTFGAACLSMRCEQCVLANAMDLTYSSGRVEYKGRV